MSEQKALVTGGSRGIGRAIATALSAKGYEVTIFGRSEKTLAEAVAQAAEGFTKLGTEPDLVHTATYTAVGDQLTEIAGKLDGMSIE